MTGNTSDFIAGLKAERDTMREFVALLEKEQQTLIKQQDPEQLLPLAETKTVFASRLTDMANARRQYISANGANPDTSAWLQQHSPGSVSLWNELRELAGRAHHLNQTNGEVIQMRLRSNQQALNTLMGAAKSTAGLYGRDGQPSIAVSGRTLGSG